MGHSTLYGMQNPQIHSDAIIYSFLFNLTNNERGGGDSQWNEFLPCRMSDDNDDDNDDDDDDGDYDVNNY
jgi:hypothetical protein